MTEIDNDKLDELCDVIDYYFKDKSHLTKGLTHSSFSYETTGRLDESNEVLEFLGDAVVNLAIAEALVDRYPGKREGDLSRMRAELVNERVLAEVARRMGLEERLRIGKSARAGEEGIPRSILADTVEALVGAVFLDGGYAAASNLVVRLIAPFMEASSLEEGTDYKTRLQEHTQKVFKTLPEYRLDGSSGPDHLRVFACSVWIEGKKLGAGTGRSIKAAEQAAARQALEVLTTKDRIS